MAADSERETRNRNFLRRQNRPTQSNVGNTFQPLSQTPDPHLRCEEKRNSVQEIEDSFVKFCTKISKDLLQGDKTAVQVIFKIPVEHIPHLFFKDVDHLLKVASEGAGDLHRLRLESIRLDSQRRRLEKRMADRDRLGDGLYLMDFEQLKIENQALNEKIDERHQELVQLKKKTSSVVQVQPIEVTRRLT